MVPIQYLSNASTANAIGAGIESAIRDQALVAGQVLPSVRGLANELHVAAGTVAAAYRMLQARGLIESRGRNGTIVRSNAAPRPRSTAIVFGPDVIDLSSGQPDAQLLPKVTNRLWASAHGALDAPREPVLPELHSLAAARLAADGVPSSDLTLASGGLDAIGRVLQARLRRGDVVGIEDPGWPNLLDQVAGLGLRAFPVPIDEHGPTPDGMGAALRGGARAVVVTSRAQNPTGHYVSADRAAELRGVLRGHPELLVIEDDHAAELAGVPLASLAAATDAWAFVRSSSKPFGPDLRLAIVSGDPLTVERLEAQARLGYGWVSTALQRLAVALWNDRPAATAVERAGAEYDRRRGRLIEQLEQEGIRASGASGLNVWIPVADETSMVAGLLQAGWAVAPGARFRQRTGSAIRVTMVIGDDAAISTLSADIHHGLTRTRRDRYTT